MDCRTAYLWKTTTRHCREASLIVGSYTGHRLVLPLPPSMSAFSSFWTFWQLSLYHLCVLIIIICAFMLNYSSLDLAGNSAVEAISLLIKKGVQESNILFLNLISVSPFPLVFISITRLDRWNYIFSNYYSHFPIPVSTPGTSRSSCGLQTFPQNKDRDIWDWNGIEQRFSCYPRDGRIRGPIFWHWWWLKHHRISLFPKFKREIEYLLSLYMSVDGHFEELCLCCTAVFYPFRRWEICHLFSPSWLEMLNCIFFFFLLHLYLYLGG